MSNGHCLPVDMKLPLSTFVREVTDNIISECKYSA